MPRKKKPGAPEPKRRSRTGCNPCKVRKVKCDERHPTCLNCERQNVKCDFYLKLKWQTGPPEDSASANSTPSPAGSEFPLNLRDAALPSLPSFERPDSSSISELSHFSASYPPRTLPALPIQPPPMPLDPALTGETIHLLSPMPTGGARYTESYERYTSSVQRTGPTLAVNAPLSAVSRIRETVAQEDSSTPSDYDMRSPSVDTFSNRSTTFPVMESPATTPPFFVGEGEEMPENAGRDKPRKRIRIGSGNDMGGSYDTSMPPPSAGSFQSYHFDHQPCSYHTPGSGSNPLTPGSDNGDGTYKPYAGRSSPRMSQESPDLRRLSVNSLLSGPPGIPAPRSNPDSQEWSGQYQDIFSDTITWGIDRGFKDLDFGKNDDMNAISGTSPLLSRDHLEYTIDGDGSLTPIEFGFGMEMSNSSFKSGSYYDKPVTIRIPRWYGELPAKLRDHPMNLLYFHHFINHTAGCLVLHNCSSNPFKSVLPQMALQDDNLLNLLLAYSASHRARLLRQPEPEVRIALWVQDIFPNLRRALDDPNQIISNANLATAIMLASLEIISPKAFGVEVPWQNHLDTARQMIRARGGAENVQTASRGDKVLSFLWSWFAYLDVLGSLSGGKANASTLMSWVSESDNNDENDYQIDCMLGFTSKCVRLLATVAELSRVCDIERVGSDHEIIASWKPAEDIVKRAEKLQKDLDESLLHPAKACTHMQSSGEAAYQWDSFEMTATNEAFHWAGLVHLHRRILGKDSNHPDVQNAVREIFGALYKVRRSSSAEACLLFPMFTAGCDTQDKRQRADILDRIKGMEMVGMTQIHKARALMERVWETGKPWETLVAGEFFG
ncbi:fungal-specific transcription factor domain-containing protein [Rhexocercosporidium sp. MPI-PUGE-AT-0058]|nr:fungal-specific transcription factor domain-containing protein [Rhexocercosporidium sp. MPI-PUGE-AT-0058]